MSGIEVVVRNPTALAFSMAGESVRALELEAELDRGFPEDTSVQTNYLPVLRALNEVDRKQPAKAIEALQSSIPYEYALPGVAFDGGSYGAMYPTYVRGLAYLALGQGTEAAAEFRKIVEHPGVVTVDPVGALARLQLGRAYAMVGDSAKASAAYGDFLTLWKDADPNIPIYRQAKAEYAKLQSAVIK